MDIKTNKCADRQQRSDPQCIYLPAYEGNSKTVQTYKNNHTFMHSVSKETSVVSVS